MIVYLYVAVIVLVFLGLILGFVYFNKRQKHTTSKLLREIATQEIGMQVGQFDVLVGQTETAENQKENIQLEEKFEKNVQKSEEIKNFDIGFEDFSLEDEKPKQTKESSREVENPFFKQKKYFFDDDENSIDESMFKDPFEDIEGLEKYEEMLQSEKDKFASTFEDDFDDDFFTKKMSSSNIEEDLKLLLEENKIDEED